MPPSLLDGYNSSRGYSLCFHVDLEYTSIAPDYRLEVLEDFQKDRDRIGADLGAKTHWRARRHDPTLVVACSQDASVLYYDLGDDQYRRVHESMLRRIFPKKGKK